jgi:adenylate kinase
MAQGFGIIPAARPSTGVRKAMKKYIIMGVQGSGKGTQARMLCKDFDLVHISVGDVFRWHIKNRTKLGSRVKRIVSSGQLVSDQMVDDIVRERLEQHDWNYGFILDGFPRNLAQGEFFLERYDTHGVIHIEVPDSVVTERILARRLCQKCGMDFNLIYYRPKVASICDVCGGTLTVRADDTLEAVQARLADYHEKTEPVLDLFRGRGLIVVADGTKGPDDVQKEIREKLGLPQTV